MKQIVIKNEELSKIAAKKLKEMIIDNEMRPGDKLPTENELVTVFGVSRSTVREAIKILTAENVVEIKRGRGTYITTRPGLVRDPLGLEFTNQSKLLDNLLETRMMIEPQISYLAAQRATPEMIERLAVIMEQFRSEGSYTASLACSDIAFHTSIAECTQNDVLQRILPIIYDSIQQSYLYISSIPGSYENSILQHDAIFQAISHRDSFTAKYHTENHLRQIQEYMEQFHKKPLQNDSKLSPLAPV